MNLSTASVTNNASLSVRASDRPRRARYNEFAAAEFNNNEWVLPFPTSVTLTIRNCLRAVMLTSPVGPNS